MNDSPLVRRFERIRDLSYDPQRFIQWNRPPFQAFGESLTLDQLHDDASGAVCLFEAVDLGDVGMVHRSQELRFSSKAGETIRILRKMIWQEFQRYVALQLRIAGAKDHTHTSFTQWRSDFVWADPCTGCNGHERPRLY